MVKSKYIHIRTILSGLCRLYYIDIIYIHIYMYRYITVIKDEVMSLKESCEDTEGVRTGRRWNGTKVNTKLT